MAGSGHSDVAASAEARWAWIVGAIILFLVAMMAYMSLHWAAMPPTRTETIDPTTLANSSRPTSARAPNPTAR
jgi:cytochrome c oxidase subunit 2